MKSWNNKGWLRIVEAFIAIILLIGAVLFIMAEQPKNTDVSPGVYEKQSNIMDYISNNDSFRNQILNGDNSGINVEISKMMDSGWDFTTNICNTDQVCNQNVPYDRNVYVKEVVITSNLTIYSPKKLVFSVWAKQ